jgi:hypothetical protein
LTAAAIGTTGVALLDPRKRATPDREAFRVERSAASGAVTFVAPEPRPATGAKDLSTFASVAERSAAVFEFRGPIVAPINCGCILGAEFAAYGGPSSFCARPAADGSRSGASLALAASSPNDPSKLAPPPSVAPSAARRAAATAVQRQLPAESGLFGGGVSMGSLGIGLELFWVD